MNEFWLFAAVRNSDIEKVSSILEDKDKKNKININIDDVTHDDDKNTFLGIASKKRNKEIVSKLLENGANVDLGDKEKRTPLHHACSDGHVDIVELLLAHGADITLKNSTGSQALDNAVINGHVDIIDQLLEKGADINDGDNLEFTALHWAAMSKEASFYVMERLLKSPQIDVNRKNYLGDIPLHLVTLSNEEDIAKKVDLLLDAGSEINEQDEVGNTPLHCAIGRGNRVLTEKLLARGANIYIKNHDGKSSVDYFNDPKTPFEIKAVFKIFILESENKRLKEENVRLNKEMNTLRSLNSNKLIEPIKPDQSIPKKIIFEAGNTLSLQQAMRGKQFSHPVIDLPDPSK